LKESYAATTLFFEGHVAEIVKLCGRYT